MKTGLATFRDRVDAGRPLAERHRRWLRSIAIVLSTAAAASCGRLQTKPEAAISSLVVRNRSFFDVNVYVLPSAAGAPLRLGTVVGTSSATFPLHASQLQSGGYLVVQLHAIGTRSSWTSNAVSVADGVLAVLDVDSDPFGDCSRSVLRTIITSEPSPP